MYSTDPKDKINCKKCGRLLDECKCPTEEAVGEWAGLKPVFQIEKKGRGGKTVTVVRNLPKNQKWLEAVCKELKAKCGSGGTVRMMDSEGSIEIQGEKISIIRNVLLQKGAKPKN